MSYQVHGPVCLPPGSEQVLDADEEIFLLYTDLQSAPDTETGGSHGLGHLDSRHDVISVTFELKPPLLENTPLVGGKRRRKEKQRAEKVIEIELLQDTTALHSRKGDTGSVLWRASVELAQLVLQHAHFPRADAPALLDLAGTNILELGAGTGLLSVALSSFAARYRATDIAPLVPLLRKNASMSGAKNVDVEELDWKALPSPKSLSSQDREVDVILAVDCIYHPSLVPALVDAIDLYTTPGRTKVVVVCELRAEDVLQGFLDTWLGKGCWNIWRVGRDGGLGRPYVIWVGWKDG